MRGFSVARVWVFAALVAMPIARAAGDEPVPRKSGADLSVYAVRRETRSAPAAPSVVEFQLSLFDLPLEGKERRFIYLLDTSSGVAVGAWRVPWRGEPWPELSHPQSRPACDVFLEIENAEEEAAAHRRVRGAGQKDIELMGLPLDRKVPISYLITRGDPERIHFSRTLAGPPVITERENRRIRLEALSERWVFSTEDLRFIEGSWGRTVTRRIDRASTRMDSLVTAREQEHRHLTADELGQLRREFALLAPIVRSTLPGSSKSASPAELAAGLARYRVEHAGGFLAPALPLLDSAVARRTESR